MVKLSRQKGDRCLLAATRGGGVSFAAGGVTGKSRHGNPE